MRAIATIAEDVARMRGVTFEDIISPNRARAILQPRHETFFIARELTTASLPMIGRRLGGRDHSTVLHGCRSIESRVRIEPLYADEITSMKEEIRAHLREGASHLAQPPAFERHLEDDLAEALRRVGVLEERVADRDGTIRELRTALRLAETEGQRTEALGSPQALFRAFRHYENERYGRGEDLAHRRLLEALTEFRTAFKEQENAS